MKHNAKMVLFAGLCALSGNALCMHGAGASASTARPTGSSIFVKPIPNERLEEAYKKFKSSIIEVAKLEMTFEDYTQKDFNSALLSALHTMLDSLSDAIASDRRMMIKIKLHRKIVKHLETLFTTQMPTSKMIDHLSDMLDRFNLFF